MKRGHRFSRTVKRPAGPVRSLVYDFDDLETAPEPAVQAAEATTQSRWGWLKLLGNLLSFVAIVAMAYDNHQLREKIREQRKFIRGQTLEIEQLNQAIERWQVQHHIERPRALIAHDALR